MIIRGTWTEFIDDNFCELLLVDVSPVRNNVYSSGSNWTAEGHTEEETAQSLGSEVWKSCRVWQWRGGLLCHAMECFGSR